MPDFLSLTADAETQAIARTLGQVLWDDLDFEREFYLIPRDTYASVPQPRGLTDAPFDRCRELGADGVVVATVRNTASGVPEQARLYNLKLRQTVFGKEYSGSASNQRHAGSEHSGEPGSA